MAEGPRRSNRVAKVKINEDYVYDEVIFEAIFNKHSKNSVTSKGKVIRQHRRTVSTCSDARSETTEILVNNSIVSKCSSWSILDRNFPLFDNEVENNDLSSVDNLTSANEVVFESRSRSSSLVYYSSDNNNSPGPAAVGQAGQRRYSSTRGDFLDLTGNFLSVASSSVFTEMSDSEGTAEEQRTGYIEGGAGSLNGVEFSRSQAAIGSDDGLISTVLLTKVIENEPIGKFSIPVREQSDLFILI